MLRHSTKHVSFESLFNYSAMMSDNFDGKLRPMRRPNGSGDKIKTESSYIKAPNNAHRHLYLENYKFEQGYVRDIS